MRGESASTAIKTPSPAAQIAELQFLLTTINERSGTIETLMRSIDQRLALLEQSADKADACSQGFESALATIAERSKTTDYLVRVTEQRSNTLEYVARQTLFALTHQQEQFHKFYIEAAPTFLNLQKQPAFNASKVMHLETDYPVAIESNDHLSPDSTTEGVTRPTLFVQDCVRVLGTEMTCLDLGTGAAGLVFEFAMNQVLAVGIDGSDFCRVNKIGYWPLLEKNLFTCDITKPFQFLSRDLQSPFEFKLITSWEVLEHIAENDLPELFKNVAAHLGKDGYFIGSISRVEYVSKAGIPYHVTLRSHEWWKQKFSESNLVMLDEHPFHEELFCRGNGPRFQDHHNYSLQPEDGFLFVAKLLMAD